MSIKENAKLQFSEKLSGALNSIEVPEWGDTIYYKNAINGEAIWRPGELTEMMREYDVEVISRVVEVIADNEATVDEAKKQ